MLAQSSLSSCEGSCSVPKDLLSYPHPPPPYPHTTPSRTSHPQGTYSRTRMEGQIYTDGVAERQTFMISQPKRPILPQTKLARTSMLQYCTNTHLALKLAMCRIYYGFQANWNRHGDAENASTSINSDGHSINIGSPPRFKKARMMAVSGFGEKMNRRIPWAMSCRARWRYCS
jgi:hypothetical protein